MPGLWYTQSAYTPYLLETVMSFGTFWLLVLAVVAIQLATTCYTGYINRLIKRSAEIDNHTENYGQIDLTEAIRRAENQEPFFPSQNQRRLKRIRTIRTFANVVSLAIVVYLAIFSFGLLVASNALR